MNNLKFYFLAVMVILLLSCNGVDVADDGTNEQLKTTENVDFSDSEGWQFYSMPATVEKGSYGYGEITDGNIVLHSQKGSEKESPCSYSTAYKASNINFSSGKLIINVVFFNRNGLDTLNFFFGDSDTVFKLPLNGKGIWEFYFEGTTGKLFFNGALVTDIISIENQQMKNKLLFRVDSCYDNSEPSSIDTKISNLTITYQ